MPITSAHRLCLAGVAGLIAPLITSASMQAVEPSLLPAPVARPIVTAAHLEQAPYAGVYNYGVQAPTFRYGWFGAEHFSPTNQAHQTYYEDVIRWSRSRRY